MRHRMKGRKLGRNASHRKAMFRNMATSLICSLRVDEDDPSQPKTPGRIITTTPKAKELRPFIEKLITLGRKSAVYEARAAEFTTTAERHTDDWRTWRNSDQWNKWNQAIAPAIALRRRAFAALRSKKAVSILFDELAKQFADRPGGYMRIVQIAAVRLGDAGQQSLIEFVGENDRVKRQNKKKKRQAPVVVGASDSAVTEETAAVEETVTEETAVVEETPTEEKTE